MIFVIVGTTELTIEITILDKNYVTNDIFVLLTYSRSLDISLLKILIVTIAPHPINKITKFKSIKIPHLV